MDTSVKKTYLDGCIQFRYDGYASKEGTAKMQADSGTQYMLTWCEYLKKG